MKSIPWIACGVLFLSLAAWLFSRSSPPPAHAASHPHSAPAPTSRTDLRPSPPTSAPPAPSPSSPGPVHAALDQEIEAAVVTYSPDALPFFEKLLSSAEPAVREAARDGLVRLGETGGAALLRRAITQLTDPAEIERFEASAAHLELPSASEGPLKKR